MGVISLKGSHGGDHVTWMYMVSMEIMWFGHIGICAAEVRPRIPTPICIWRELVWISSLAHENRCWPPPNLRLISSKSAALQCPVVQVYQRSLGTSCNITTHVDNRAPLTSTSVKQAEPVRKRIPPTIPPHT